MCILLHVIRETCNICHIILIEHTLSKKHIIIIVYHCHTALCWGKMYALFDGFNLHEEVPPSEIILVPPGNNVTNNND